MREDHAFRARDVAMKMIILRDRPLPSFQQNDLSRAVDRLFEELELFAAIAHGRWSIAVRAGARRYAALGLTTRSRTVSARRAMQRSAAVAWRWSLAFASFTAERARRLDAVGRPIARRAVLFAARRARLAAQVGGNWLRKFAGVDPTEEVVELELMDLVPLEDRLLAGIGAPRLPSFDAPTSNDVELELMPELGAGGDRASEVCSPAVVRLAKMSGREARVDCSPISVTASTWRPVRVSRARFGTTRG
jgi:hypothetical protein